MLKTIRDLRRAIGSYIENQPSRPGRGPLTMQDLADKAEECQARIRQLGYTWDNERGLWRAPIEGSNHRENR